MAVAQPHSMHHSIPNARRLWLPKRPRLHAMNTALKPVSMLMARFLCVALRRMPSGLIDIATKISPASAAAPPPTMTKKLVHCSSIGSPRGLGARPIEHPARPTLNQRRAATPPKFPIRWPSSPCGRRWPAERVGGGGSQNPQRLPEASYRADGGAKPHLRQAFA